MGSSQIEAAATVLAECFEEYSERFSEITARAQARFEVFNWAAARDDAVERLELYPLAVTEAEERLRTLLGHAFTDKDVWERIKRTFSVHLAGHYAWDLGETFFNSITRRVFATMGVDPRVEFVDTDFAKPPTRPRRELYHLYDQVGTPAELVDAILTDFRFGVLYTDVRRDAKRVAIELEARLAELGPNAGIDRAELIKPVFYRGRGAYLVGRLYSGEQLIPIVLALRSTDTGVAVDAVLLDEDAVSILFSFTRSYFHVATARPYELVQFLQTLMPRKLASELYNAVGFHKHGKTEQYREILSYLARSDVCFELAPGARGLVMVVFTMPGLGLVFKVLRDRFGPPKRITRRAVRAKYALVFKHDRVGRLIDAHEFEHLELDRAKFSDELLAELAAECGATVQLNQATVGIEHVYIERRVTPLDLYVREAGPEEAAAAVVDYGWAIKDLAVNDVFPGDLLLKNFGVTRHGRVVFYDYDELTSLGDCVFRALPEPSPGDEMADVPPWGVGARDVFPEEFRSFLGLPPALREVFEQHHAELLTPQYWQAVQGRVAAGELIEVLPYNEAHRLG